MHAGDYRMGACISMYALYVGVLAPLLGCCRAYSICPAWSPCWALAVACMAARGVYSQHMWAILQCS